MKFFIDSANIEEIIELKELGLIDGVTTNPSLIANSGNSFLSVIKEICFVITDGPVSAEVISTEKNKMIKEGEKLASIAKNVCIKLPLTEDGIYACNHFRKNNIQTNVTLCFSASQAIAVAKVNSNFVSPFIGRLDDIGHSGMNVIREIREIYRNYKSIKTEILAASIRNPIHLIEAARMGADAVTVPYKVIKQLFFHPLTDKGLDIFLKDANLGDYKII